MFKRPARWMATVALAAAFTACDEGQGPTDVTVVPTGQELFTELTSADLSASLTETDLTLDAAAAYTIGTGATLVSTATSGTGTVTIAIVGKAGGTITAGDHSLVIPRNAVRGNTEFRMEVVAGDKVLVDLSARTVGSGAEVSSFPVALTMTLSYRNVLSTNDARRFKNVYLYLDSPSYLVPLISTLDQQNKTLSSPITHFSKYGMAME